MVTPVPVAADMRIKEGTKVENHTCGVDGVTPGDVMYLDTTTKKYLKAINTSEAAAHARGIAMNYADTDEMVVIVPHGGVILSDTSLWDPGKIYMVGDAAGQMFENNDIGSGDWATMVGFAHSATEFKVHIEVGGFALA